MGPRYDPDKLFDILDKGFDNLESGITDRTRRMEMRMENTRQRIEERMKRMGKLMEEKGRLAAAARRQEILDHDYEEVPDVDARRRAMKNLRFMFTITFLLFFCMGLIFLWAMADKKESSKTSPPPIEQPAQSGELKKL